MKTLTNPIRAAALVLLVPTGAAASVPTNRDPSRARRPARAPHVTVDNRRWSVRRLVGGLVAFSALVGPAGRAASAMPIPLSQFTGETIGNTFYGPISFSSSTGTIDPTQVTVDTSGGGLLIAFNGQANNASGGTTRGVNFSETASALPGYSLVLASAAFQGGVSGQIGGPPAIVFSETPSPAPMFSFGGHFTFPGYSGQGSSQLFIAPSLNVTGGLGLNDPVGGSAGVDSLQLFYNANAVVPEPSGLVLTGLGVLGVLAYSSKCRSGSKA